VVELVKEQRDGGGGERENHSAENRLQHGRISRPADGAEALTSSG
jgi:hypothetical protein